MTITTDQFNAMVNKRMPEAALQQEIIGFARSHGWLVWHDNATNHRRKCPHCGSPISGPRNQAGFPDLVLVRGIELIFAELKTESGKLTPEQETWAVALVVVASAIPGRFVKYCLWRPSDREQIWEILQ